MTPAARVQAAIEMIDRIRAGEPAEKALTSWARRSRFAGAKDRAAIRDHVFDALRMWNTAALAGGGESGRARMIGVMRLQGLDPAETFTGQGHAPAALSEAEQAAGSLAEGRSAWDLPDWLAERFAEDLGDQAEPTALALRSRAPVFVRANLLKTTRDAAQANLAEEGVVTEPHPLSGTALIVLEGARGLVRTRAFEDGWIELQDAASQAVVDAIPMGEPLTGGGKILDFCAGGGGKTLALAALAPGALLHAHDIDARRMTDLPARAERAGAKVRLVADPVGPYDLVVADAPCSGSGAWRRAPEGKWRLTPARLSELNRIQDQILRSCAALVAKGGTLAYATCSVLRAENEDRVARFLAGSPGWVAGPSRRLLPSDGGDGFFVACLMRDR